MNIHESAEDYLERVLMIRQRKGVVYSIDIVHELNFSKPSVSVAMKRLRENGYIQMDADGAITLLRVSPENAAADACKIEHDISEESYERIKEVTLQKRTGLG